MGKVTEKIIENKTKGKECRTFCPSCNRQNTHTVVVSADHQYIEDIGEDYSVDSENNYQVIQCKCGHLSFRELNWCSELQDHDWNGQTETIYPKKETVAALATKDFKNIPDKLQQIYAESIGAYNNEFYILCTAGLRGIVEGICSANAVEDGPVEVPAKGGGTKIIRSDKLHGKIAGLEEKNIITKAYADILHEHRFLGNDAIHDLEPPTTRDLKNAIEIIEHIIEQLFEIPKKAERLKARRLARSV